MLPISAISSITLLSITQLHEYTIIFIQSPIDKYMNFSNTDLLQIRFMLVLI